MRFVSIGWFACGFAATLLVSAVVDMAWAQGYGPGRRAAPGYGYVVAESITGNGRVRGAVRQTSLGPQVQLPGGSWIYCRRSCSETLRVESIDFWEARNGFNGRSVGGGERGIGGFIWRW